MLQAASWSQDWACRLPLSPGCWMTIIRLLESRIQNHPWVVYSQIRATENSPRKARSGQKKKLTTADRSKSDAFWTYRFRLCKCERQLRSRTHFTKRNQRKNNFPFVWKRGFRHGTRFFLYSRQEHPSRPGSVKRVIILQIRDKKTTCTW